MSRIAPPSSATNQRGTMTVMSPGERQLMRLIITEKEERTKAVDDMSFEFSKLKDKIDSQLTTALSVLSQPAKAVTPQKIDAVSSEVVQSLTSQIQDQRTTMTNQQREFSHSLEALRTSLQRAEVDANEGRSKAAAMQAEIKDLRDKITNMGTKAGLQSEHLVDKDGSVNNVPTTAIWRGKDEEIKPILAAEQNGGADPKAMQTCLKQVKNLEDKNQGQEQEMTSMRSVLIELHVNISLYSLRASRIALRSPELSREERRLALGSLDTKERRIRAEVSAIRDKSSQCPASTLSDIHKVAMENDF
mmetsp:Transcript_33644/g.76256  ORF Transcript_33644/g.76256 Transcript_33644/m.76256 type:complete len:304 (-) Transcript_33644:86-997(-)